MRVGITHREALARHSNLPPPTGAAKAKAVTAPECPSSTARQAPVTQLWMRRVSSRLPDTSREPSEENSSTLTSLIVAKQ